MRHPYAFILSQKDRLFSASEFPWKGIGSGTSCDLLAGSEVTLRAGDTIVRAPISVRFSGPLRIRFCPEGVLNVTSRVARHEVGGS